jgi:uncharacterized membrane protein SpoIIM required for sporulation
VSNNDGDAGPRLQELLDRAERLGRRLPFEDLRELARTYRLSSARLATLRSRSAADPEEIRYLNALCVRAYTYLRVEPPRRVNFGRFFLADFPTTLAMTARVQALAAALMLAGALIGVALVSSNPGTLSACIPAAMYPPERLEQLADSAHQRAEFLEPKPFAFGLKSVFSATLFVHNVTVGLAAFASGVLAGAPTILLLLYNGLTLGAFAWIFSRDSDWLAFWAWLLPHGIPELLAVNLCSAGGLLVAKAVVAPGRAGAAKELRAAAQPALELLAASLPLFFVAALIESFIRQSFMSMEGRYCIAGGALAAIVEYVLYIRHLMAKPSIQGRSDFSARAG